jgi:signal recognition particle subunit SRP19
MASVSIDSSSDNERFQDEDDFDVDNMDFDLPSAPVAVQPTASGSTSRSSAAGGPSVSAQQQAMLNAFGTGPASSSSSVYSNSAFGGGVPNNSRIVNAGDASKYKHYQTIYPIYIDRSRAHKNGERRISKTKAIRFPKAQEIAEVCGRFFGLAPVFEPEKTHPRDWENPGRVRVLPDSESKEHLSFMSSRQLNYLAIPSIRIHPPHQARRSDRNATQAKRNIK